LLGKTRRTSRRRDRPAQGRVEDEYQQWQSAICRRAAMSTSGDGVYLQARMSTAECMLVLIGARPRAEGVDRFPDRHAESAQSWKELLVDLKALGLSIAPEVAVGDGALASGKLSTRPSLRRVTNVAGCTRR